MPQKRGGGSIEDMETTGEDKVFWLTFMNKSCLGEDKIRAEFTEFGPVVECDGAIDGPSDGWVMVGLGSASSAQTAMTTLQSRDGSEVGSTLQMINTGQPQETEEKSSVQLTSSSGQQLEDENLGGLQQFIGTSNKVLEMVTQNNQILQDRIKESHDEHKRQLQEKEEEVKKLTSLLTSKDDHLRKLTARLNSTQDFEDKVKKFFGENEDFHKKKVAELTAANSDLVSKVELSEKMRMDRILEDADSGKVREAVEGLGTVVENIQSKTEQVWAVVSVLDSSSVTVGVGGQEPVSSTVGLLHNKVDKMVRLMVETSENQKKMNKVLQDLLKVGNVKAESTVISNVEEDNQGGGRKRRRDRGDISRGRSRSREEEGRSKRSSRSPDSSLDSAALPPPSTANQIDHEFEEMKWGLNMALIGDGHWKSFNVVEDIKNIVDRMERKVNLRVMGREGETLSRMYDEQRDNLISSLPGRCFKVGISVGTNDLKDNSLITLNEASMEEVRRRNEPKLVSKASVLRNVVIQLIEQNKSVVVMIPPHGEERIELHHHWEEVLLVTLKEVPFPRLRILNMAQVMRSTMAEFRNNDEYLDMWLATSPRPRRYLSPYGTRRMFYALRQCVTAKSPQAAGMGNWCQGALPPPSAGQQQIIPNPADFPCPRCTRRHPQVPQDKCKSVDKLCRKCNNVGHFTEIHDVTDPGFRQLIVTTLGLNLWGDAEPQPVDRRQLSLEKLSEMERRMGLKDDVGAVGQGAARRGGDSWYN